MTAADQGACAQCRDSFRDLEDLGEEELAGLTADLLWFYGDEPDDASLDHLNARYTQEWHDHGHSPQWEDSVWR